MILRVGQSEASDGMKAYLSLKGGVCEEGWMVTVRPSVEGSEKFTVISSDGFVGDGGEAMPTVEHAISTFTSPIIVRSRPNGLPDRGKDAGEATTLHAHCGEFDHATRGGSDERDGDPDRMEFEGESEVAAVFLCLPAPNH